MGEKIRASSLLSLGLYGLNHRGQEACGIVTFDGNDFYAKKSLGLVVDNFSSRKQLKKLKGHSGIGQVRYATVGGSDSTDNIQPFLVDLEFGKFALAHNGELTNYLQIKNQLKENGSIFSSTSDTEIIIHLVALSKKGNIVDRLIDALKQVVGAYSLISLTKDYLIGVRDPHGIRPLVLGRLNGAYILSSETTSLDILGAEFIRDVEPGEMIIISQNGIESRKPFEITPRKLCIFEFVYFSRPDSTSDNLNMYSVRKKIGHQLANEFHIDADMVIPVPDSGTPAALGYAENSGIPLELGIVRSHFSGRTFIRPTDEIRNKSIRLKLNPNKSLIAGKKIILVDDSLVRGSTAKNLIKILRDAGATEIHLLIASPPVAHSCFYGISTQDESQLMAANHSIEEMTSILGVNTLGFVSMNGLHKAVNEDNSENSNFCNACFSGKYPVPLIDRDKNAIRFSIESPDHPEILELLKASHIYHSELYPTKSNHILSSEELKSTNVTFLVARINGKIQGCGALVRDDGWAEVKSMFVSPDARRCGLGRLLLEKLEKNASVYGISKIRLETGIRQSEALALYRSSGFTEIKPFAQYEYDPLSVFMEKII